MTTQTAAKPVRFKCEHSMWKQLQSGHRSFDPRPYDLSDDRIYRLSFGRVVDPGGFVPDEKVVVFVNKETGAEIERRFLGLEFAAWAPGWVFLRLEHLVVNDEPR